MAGPARRLRSRKPAGHDVARVLRPQLQEVHQPVSGIQCREGGACRLVRAPLHIRRFPFFRRGQQADVSRARQGAAVSHMRILGISAFYHDSAAALLVDGRIVAAAQEERFTRRKQDARFPEQAIAYCLAEARIKLDKVDYVVFYEKPFLKFERLLETYVGFAPLGFRSFATAIPVWIREKLFQKDLIGRELRKLAPEFDLEKRLLF